MDDLRLNAIPALDPKRSTYSAISRREQAPRSAFCAFEFAGVSQNRSSSLAIFPPVTR
jgi:hypothetical protein